jgi:hypothetical protein
MRSTARFAAMTILACLAVSTARGQQTSPIAAGGWILGGSANVSHSHDDLSDLSSTSVGLSPYALRFVAPRLAVGESVTLS